LAGSSSWRRDIGQPSISFNATVPANEGGVVALRFPREDLLEVRTWQPDETYRAIATQVVAGGRS